MAKISVVCGCFISKEKREFTLTGPRASFSRPSQKLAQALSAHSHSHLTQASGHRVARAYRRRGAVGVPPTASRGLSGCRSGASPCPHPALLPASASLSLSPERQQQPRVTPPSPWPSPPMLKLLRNARRSLTPTARGAVATSSCALFR
jgi:hypothetical protein